MFSSQRTEAMQIGKKMLDTAVNARSQLLKLYLFMYKDFPSMKQQDDQVLKQVTGVAGVNPYE